MFFLENNTSQKNNTYVVGIGASAGGLEAINEFFDNVLDAEHMAFVVVQHLSSDYKSLLVELLAKHTTMPVEEAIHRKRVEAGNVYVIPNNKELTIHDGMLMLGQKEFDKGPNTAIDIFFQSLAQDQREYAVAILLSGTGTDGTKGIETIKSNNGFVIVQDPLTAKFDGMPKSAITSGYVDLVIPPADIYNQVGNYIDGLLPSKITRAGKYVEQIQGILTTVYKRTGYDFAQYKQPTVLRRINRRMQLVKVEDMASYEKYIKHNDDESALLAKEFFIGVTNFFRDKDAFACLYSEVIVKLVEQKEEYESLKVWVTACSTGQEVYSIAIFIDKALRQLNKNLDVKIFASDIDKSAIEFASKGKYQRNQLMGIEKKILQEYFTEVEDGVAVIQRIRKQIVFATHDMLKDPPFIKNDLVTCRNFLIYLDPSLQENVLSTLHFALNPGGYLFLGTSENPALLRRGFSEVNNKWKIYQRTSEQHQFQRRIPSSDKARTSPLMNQVAAKLKTDAQLGEDFRKVLVEQLGYAGLYINENYEIKEGIGNFRKYLSLPDKLSVLNIVKMAPAELSGVLSTGLRKCLKENAIQSLRNIKAKFGDQQRLIDIFIYPPKQTTNGLYLLVVFADCIIENDKSSIGIHDISLLQKDQYVRQLEEELRETRTNLQMAVEGLETANEELQSSNEELQSANEELQSSNEELQSLNEELHTLNTEHQIRIQELIELNDDMTNYLQTSLIGQIFLDQKLRIRRFNQAASSVVNIIDGDIGRPIDHITQHIKASTFLEDIKSVNNNGTPIEREIELENGSVYLIRILPYLRQQKMRDGLVITMVDVSATRDLNSIIKGVFDASINPIFVFEAQRNKEGNVADYVCKIANFAAYHSFGRKTHEDGLMLKKDFPELATTSLFKKFSEGINNNNYDPVSSEISFIKNEKKSWYQAGITKLQDGFILVLTDITQRKEAEEKLRRNYNELLVTKETLRELNNQLEAKVKERTRVLEISEERFRMVASLTNDVIWDWHFVSNNLWWSEGYYDVFGFATNDPQVQKHSSRIKHIHPDDRHRVQEAFNAVLQGITREFNVAYRYRKNNGEYAHVLDRGTVLTEEHGIPYRMIGALVDVTRLEQATQQVQKKNAELQSAIQQFRFVTDFMPQMVWAAQPNGYHDFYNQQWYDYTGLDQQQANNNSWAVVLHSEDYEKAWKVWQHSLETGDPFETEYRMRRRDGHYRWFLARAYPMQDEHGAIVKWFGTCTDIDDQKRAEQLLEDKIQSRTRELKLLNKRLEASNSDLLQFASVASHDLKEPLRKIHFFSGLIREQLPEDINGTIATYIDRIIKASSRATNLINDVLSYSRLSNDNLFTKVDLNKIVQEILQDFELVIQEKDAQIKVEKLPVITAVPGQMRQLFQNIINNALKFHKPNQPPFIQIACNSIEKNDYADLKDTKGVVYEIKIKDDGIGFDNQYAQKIFSLFQRLNNKEKYEGTGIGLAIANKIVERHQGLIVAKGETGKGAEFNIILPEEQAEHRQAREELAKLSS